MSVILENWTKRLRSMNGAKCVVVADKRGMTREDWLLERKKGVGGSDIGKILGHSKYGTSLDVFLEKTNRKEKVFTEEQQEILDSGTDMEELIIDLYKKKTGRKVEVVNGILAHPDYPMARVNVDAIVQDENGRWGVLEVKNSLARGDEWKDGKVPLAYEDQCRYGMWIMGFEFGEVISLRAGRWTKESIYPITRSIKWEDTCKDELTRFWLNHIEPNEQPVLESKDDPILWKETLSELIASMEMQPKETMADQTTAQYIQEAMELKKNISRMEKEFEAVKGILAAQLNGPGTIHSDFGSVTWKVMKGSSKFDRKAFEKENPELVTRYVSIGEPTMRMELK